jgi:phospholipase C
MVSDVEPLPLNVQLTDRSGHLIKPFHQNTVCEDGLTPAWGASIVDYDDGKMNNFMHTTNPSTIDPDGTRAMGYYDWTDLPFYYEVATQFATSDRFFSSVGARTPVNRQYMAGASSYGNVDFGPVPGTAPTIFDRVKAAGYTWKWYYLPQIKTLSIKGWHTYVTDPQNVVPISEYFTDLQNNTLPQVAFIERVGSGLDEHPTNNIQRGAADMATEVNAFLASSSWPTSVMFLAFDEGGGLYDHVKPLTVVAPDNIPPKLSELQTPKPGDFTRSGFRVPLMVISPWVKPGYVSHVPRELTSILKFIETRFALPPLTARDAAADDMTEMFDFTNPALLTPPPLPAQPTNGHCNPSLEVSPQHP